MKLEACDLTRDSRWAQDGGLIRGASLPSEPGSAAELGGAPIYINNCRFGLHGPIEVLTAAAVAVYARGLPRCSVFKDEQRGEGEFMDRCMVLLGVSRFNMFNLLSETACGEDPVPCCGPHVAFHPFKQPADFFACEAFARFCGEGGLRPAASGAEGG
uniref:Uncharacterized protein n=1 Tax=Zooxanthella nutricula TaxID=1333877 RepID=A0A7S2K6I8_9DINO|mmetsp:Transcript_42642/g.128853  ORF Transcript_42642/g.128853 Transcript_42642/m.128853 type:complete len:158 (+) Transcript_42642:2-475(+)